MANPVRRGQAGAAVSTTIRGDNFTPQSNTSWILPYGLRLQQTISTTTSSVSIPTGITWVYAIVVGGGAGGTTLASGGAGGLAWGWTLANTSCTVGTAGSGGNAGNPSRYGHIIAGGGGGQSSTPVLGGSSGGPLTTGTNYYGMQGAILTSNQTTTNNLSAGALSGYENYGFYFDNDYPKKNEMDLPFNILYTNYINNTNYTKRQ